MAPSQEASGVAQPTKSLRGLGVGLLLVLGGALSASCKADAPKPSAESGTATASKPASEAAAVAPASAGPALTIAYSDWPGWVAWDIGLKKGWFDAAGVKVDFKWFEYVPSMEAFSAGKVDAVAMTNGDQLVTGASGAPSVALLLNDYSNGNDMIVAKAGIESLEQLKGKKIGVEVGFVSHLLLLNALKQAKLSDKDIEIVNVPTDQTPQALKSGSVDAIVAWQPNSGQALREVAGSKAIFTSANLPGIIYDVLAVNPKSLAERQPDWEKVAGVWFQIVDYIQEEKNKDDVLSIMSARVGLSPEQYAGLMKGTFFLDAEGNAKHYRQGDSLESVFFSSKMVDGFNIEHGVYKVSQKPESYLNADSITKLAAKSAVAPAVSPAAPAVAK
ncbi:MAG TPA: ABC transporter substrate-binding protein [Polyangiaceae bacterium]|nr:ABC transporter substrate-binding protein [Polyangiaceae bacterium]